ncbi:MAG: DUF1398 domain-containing protein, partial [Chloroflexota bacterium]
MDTTEVQACVDGSAQGTMTFPDVVGRLLATGVERYTVDLVSMEHRTYGQDGEVETTPMPLAAGAVAETFDAAAVQAAILGAQQGRILYPEFVERIRAAGVASYVAYLTGRRVVYT